MTNGISVPPLNNQSLLHLSQEIVKPRYNRKAVRHGIVHFGVGGFHRAHQALYTEELLEIGGDSQEEIHQWGICGVGLMPQDKTMERVLKAQDGLYTLIERDYQQERLRVVGAITDYILAPGNSEKVLAKLVSPDVKIVSLTITEGGYCYNEATEELDADHPSIRHDLLNPNEPEGIYGFLVEGLYRRKQEGIPPFTIMSCDNIQSNGDITKKMVLAFAQLRDPKLSQWIADYVTFPNSMVDRITPTTTDDDRAGIVSQWEYQDQWPVVCEGFRQWVIEDNFCYGRPPWEQVGAQMTEDVHPYELMKIRLLNASHAAIGYLAFLDGFQYIHEAMADPLFETYIKQLMDREVTPLLSPVPGVDMAEYKQTLIKRFANPSVKDLLIRLCTDGSSRMPKFMLPSIQEQLNQGGPIRLLSLGIAGWFRFLSGVDEKGNAIQINDPMADTLKEQANLGKTNPQALLGIKTIFGDFLPNASPFVNYLKEDLESLYRVGARATLAKVMKEL